MANDKLGELEKRLYKPDERFSERKEEFAKILGPQTGQPQVPPPAPPVIKVKPTRGSSFFRMRPLFIWGLVGLVLLAAAAGLYAVFFRGPKFFRRDVVVTLNAPEKVRGGEEIELRVHVQNNTPFPLADTELGLAFPEGTIVAGERRLRETRPLGLIEAQSQREETVSLRLFGPKDAVKTFSARLTYRPGEISSRFENQAETAATIVSTPFRFSLDLPKEAFPGSSVEYVFTYENTAGIEFSDVAVMVLEPGDFVAESASPEATEEIGNQRLWGIGEVATGRKGKITLVGSLKPGARLDQEIRAEVGVVADGEFVPYAEVSGITRLVEPFLRLEPTVAGHPEYAAQLGERILYQTRWSNVGQVGLENVRIRAKLVGDLFDLETLEVKGGVFDSRTNEIVWTSREAPELAIATPNEGGTVSFEVGLKKTVSIQTAEDREFTLEVLWAIETTTVPKELHVTRIINEAKVLTPVTSRAELAALGFYNDPSRTLVNTGPFPPRVNETTAYTVHWLLKTFANPVERIEVSAFLAPGVEFLGKTASLAGDTPLPQFNSRTGEVTWSIPRLEPGTGILQSAVEVVFQIALTPSLLQKNTAPLLVSDARLTAVDAFTKVRLDAVAPRITTATIEGGGIVQ